jgi:hypothetical protein
MTVYSLNHAERGYGMLLPSDTISLIDAEVDWAKEQSQSLANASASWQTYLNALARIGLQHWLEKRSPELLENADQFLQRPAGELCEITVGNYRLYLVATDAVDDSEVALPHTAITTDFNPRLYILIEIFEELQQVHICGYLPQPQVNQLLQHQIQQQAAQSAAPDLYWLSVTDFDLNSDRLLLCLNCLEPIEINRSAANPSPAFSNVTAAAINVGRWLQDQVDRVAQELAWILLPPIPSFRMGTSLSDPFLSSSGELRPLQSPTEEFNRLISDLIRNAGLSIPPDARGAYRDWQWETLNLRLYVTTWELPLAGSPSNWALLLVLGAQPGFNLPLGLQLQVRDETQVLEEPILVDTSSVYLYAQVIGTQEEQFWVTLSLPNGAAMTLPPFTFSSN